MKFSISILAGLLSISSTAVGDIVAITVPKRLSVDEDFTGYLNSVGNSSKMASLAVVFGAAPIKYAREKKLGTAILGRKTLDSRILRVSDHDYNISVPLTVPANFPKGETVVTAALYSRVGGRPLPITFYYNVTVNVTDDMDDDDDEHDDDNDDDDDMDDIEYVRSSGFLTSEKSK